MDNIGVFAVIVKDNKVLLGKRNYGNYYWTLPGGKIENKEKIIDALKREVQEETNQEIIVDKYVLTSYDINKYSIALVYKCRIEKKNELKFPESELSEVKWFDIDCLPSDLTERQQKWICCAINDFVGVLEI